VRRLNAAYENNALHLYGPDGTALPVPKFDGEGKLMTEKLVEAQTTKDTGAFLDLKKSFEDALNEEERCFLLR
jgi:hypothetical protein